MTVKNSTARSSIRQYSEGRWMPQNHPVQNNVVRNMLNGAMGWYDEGEVTTRKWIFRERVHFLWEWKTHSHENNYFHEGDVNPRRENMFSWECSTHRHENHLFMKVNSHEISKLSRNSFVKVNSHEIPNSHEIHSWRWTLMKYKKTVMKIQSWECSMHRYENQLFMKVNSHEISKLLRNPFVKVNSHEISKLSRNSFVMVNSHEIQQKKPSWKYWWKLGCFLVQK
jgi:hypothetical protein